MYQAEQRDFPVRAFFFFSLKKRSKVILAFFFSFAFFSSKWKQIWSFRFLIHLRGECKDEMTYPEACLALAALNLSPYTDRSE